MTMNKATISVMHKIDWYFKASTLDRSILNAEEKRIVDLLTDAEPRIKALRKEGDFKGELAELSRLAPSINSFFDNVLINHEDSKIRQNRQAICACIALVVGDWIEILPRLKGRTC